MIKAPARQLLQHGKPIEFGLYEDLIAQPKTTFWDDEGFPLKRRRTQRKTWIFYGVYSKDLFGGIAIVDAGVVATAFSYFFVPSEGLFVEDKITLPFGFSGRFDPAMTDEWKLGKYRIFTEDGRMQLSYSGKFNLKISTVLNRTGVSIVAPSQGRPFNFTYKNLPMQADMSVTYQGKSYGVSGKFGAVDFTKGYPPRETRWNWSSYIGETEKNLSIACNLVDQFNANMENILWLGNQRIVLSDVIFSPGVRKDKDPWHIKTKDGILDMQFYPMGARSENLNAGVMKSVFIQPFGRYEGTVIVECEKQQFTAYGVAEDHLAVW
jgi:hypothetical protein